MRRTTDDGWRVLRLWQKRKQIAISNRSRKMVAVCGLCAAVGSVMSNFFLFVCFVMPICKVHSADGAPTAFAISVKFLERIKQNTQSFVCAAHMLWLAVEREFEGRKKNAPPLLATVLNEPSDGRTDGGPGGAYGILTICVSNV